MELITYSPADAPLIYSQRRICRPLINSDEPGKKLWWGGCGNLNLLSLKRLAIFADDDHTG